ncbi:MAG: aliphatic sulfonate ABC transporter permease SsuC [Burkholderiaceae bacterium]
MATAFASVGRRLQPWLVPLLLVGLWQWLSAAGWLSTRVLPAPVDVVRAAWQLAASGELWTHLKVSAGRALAGLAVGGGLGLALGLLTGSVRLFETLLDSTIQMIRNIPALALIPLVILWFGIDESAKLFLISVSVFFPIYLNTFHGIRNVDPQLIEMGRSYGLGRWGLYRDVILPGALSSILVGLRFSLGLMWVILIVAETISAQSGIGYLTMNAREFLQTDVVLVGILLYALLGKLADLLARGLEQWWLRWHPGYQVQR